MTLLTKTVLLAVGLAAVSQSPCNAGQELVHRDNQKGVASYLCYGVYCEVTICVEITDASNGTPGTARFFYEGGIFGDLRDVGEYTGKHCVTDWGIGVLAMRIEIKAVSGDLVVKVADRYDN